VRGLKELVNDLNHKGVRAAFIPAAAGTHDEHDSLAMIPVEDEAGVPLYFSESRESLEEQCAEVEAEDGFNHGLELKRLDHLAAVARNLDAQTHFWTHFLGIPLFGEVVTPAMVIRQFRIGDAVIELLGPNSPESPLHKRSPGLISMMSVEVANVQAAVNRVRSAGLTISEPATGVLPGTSTATSPAAEASGMGLQLLEYA
jgi:catechol 2,3-dioxygenase-like lactoylglutathione lyase family enzyme